MNILPAPPVTLASQGTYPNGGSTFVAPLPQDAYYDTSPGRMRLAHDGNHWTSSFQTLLRALVQDQMSDGPLTVYLSVQFDGLGDGRDFLRVSGMLTGLTDTALVFEDGYQIPLANVLDIEI